MLFISKLPAVSMGSNLRSVSFPVQPAVFLALKVYSFQSSSVPTMAEMLFVPFHSSSVSVRKKNCAVALELDFITTFMHAISSRFMSISLISVHLIA